MARSFRFGLRIADFILSRTSSLSAATPSHFFHGVPFYQGHRPQWPFYQRQWPFYQGRPATKIDFKLAKLTFRRGGPRNQPGVGFRVFTFTGIGSTAAG